MEHAAHHKTEQMNIIYFLLEVFYIFTIMICYDKNGDLGTAGIKFNNCEKNYSLKNTQ